VIKILCWNKSEEEKKALERLLNKGKRRKDKYLDQDAQHLESYSIESQFYTYIAPLIKGLSLPKVYYNYEDTFNHKFVMVMEDLNHLENGQPYGFGFHDSFSCLKKLASLHASFWFHPELYNMKVWDIAGHWTGKKNELEKRTVLASWEKVLSNFGGYLVKEEPQKGLGQRMHNNLDKIFGDFKSFPNRTLLHGDYKITNLFVDNSRKEPKVFAIDWQWTGRGTGALDVAYFVCTSADVSSLTTHNIKHLVKKAYHANLLKKVTKRFTGPLDAVHDYPFKMFWNEFMICVIDFVIYCICNKWSKMTPATVEHFAANKHDGLHLRSYVHMQKLIDLAESFLNNLNLF